jgi:carboxymethylenebutenolidase
MRETLESVPTPDGTMPTYVIHPDDIHVAWPTVIFLMDGASIRPELRDMASRLATAGYCVLLPYLFYRSGPYREFSRAPDEIRLRRDYITALSTGLVLSDVTALLNYAQELPASSDGPIGVLGYCMSGAWALAAASAFPSRVAAAAAVHGGHLVTDAEDSPHLNLKGIQGKVYISWADDDPTAPVEGIPAMRAALAEADVEGDVELMAGALHGFAAPGGDRYDRAASERHWQRLHELFGPLRKRSA